MTEQECIEKVSQAMRDAHKHSKGKTVDSTSVSRVDHGSQQSTAQLHGRLLADAPSQNLSLDVARKPLSLFHEDTDQISDRLVLQQHSLFPASFDAATYASSPYVSEAPISRQYYSTNDEAHLSYEYNTRVGRIVSGKRKDMLTSNLDNTEANWRSTSSRYDDGRISRSLSQATFQLDSKNPAVDIPKHHSQKQQQQKDNTEKSSNEKEHDSFDEAINEFLGPLQEEDIENAFKVD
jgi:hypothetical protein